MTYTDAPLRSVVYGAVLLLVLDRPERANILSAEMIEALATRIGELRHTPDVRALVLTGSGNKVFCAGADVSELAGLGEVAAQAKMRHGQAAFRELELLPIPVIAAVNGFALGGGLELAMACDLRIAAASAQFGQPEIMLGNVPGWGGTHRLPRLVGPGKAAALIFGGERVDAAEALRIGLINQVVPDDQVITAALELAEKFAARSPVALAGAKRAIRAGLEQGPEAAETAEAAAVAACCQTPAQQDAVAAFLATRRRNGRAGS